MFSRGRRKSDSGFAALEFLAILGLTAAVVGSITLLNIPPTAETKARRAVCQIFQQKDQCGPDALPPGAVVPESRLPAEDCLAEASSDYGELIVKANLRRFFALSEGGTLLQMRRYARGGGQPDKWQVWELTWMAGGPGIELQRNKVKGFKENMSAGIWAQLEGADTNIYEFDSKEEAQKFYKMLEGHRGVNNPLKLGVRTNPITKPFVSGLGRLPGVGKWFKKKLGTNDPERKPDQEYLEGGMWNGFFNNVKPEHAPAGLVGKNMGWTSSGVWKDHKSGEITVFFQGSQQLMESIELDAKALNELGKGGSRKLADIEKKVSEKIGRQVKRIPDQLRAPLSGNAGTGVGWRGTTAAWMGLTFKDGKPVRFTQIEDLQDSWHLRGDGALGPYTAWYQQSVKGERTRTTKTLDLTDPEDAKAFDKMKGDLGLRALPLLAGPLGYPVAPHVMKKAIDEAIDAGHGTMSKVDYDNFVHTGNSQVNTPLGGLEFEDEGVESRAREASYWKPGTGWVRWDKCGLN